MILNVPIEITDGEKFFLLNFFDDRSAAFNPLIYRLSKGKNFQVGKSAPTQLMEVMKDYDRLLEKGIFIIESSTGNVKLSSTGLKIIDMIDRDKKLEEILR